MIQLSLDTYGSTKDLSHFGKVGTDRDPVEITIRHDNMIVNYFYRKPIGNYIADFDQCFRVASEILLANYRPFVLLFPKESDFLSDDEVIKSLFHWTLLAHEDTWAQELKNSLLTTFSRAEKQEVPQYRTPHTPHIFRGHFGIHMYRNVFRKNRVGLIWRNTILHGIKKGVPTVSSHFIKDALEKHGNLLKTDDRAPKEFLNLVERVSKIVFRDVGLKQPRLFHKVSQNATVERNKSAYGALDLIYSPGLNLLGDLAAMFYHPKDGCFEVRTNKFDSELSQYRNIYRKGSSRWKVEIIREPLKVRTITKGETSLNASWSDIQKQLWKALQRYHCFGLTQGLRVENFHETQLHPYAMSLQHDWGYASGDYSSATDSIKREVMISATAGIKDVLLRNLIIDNLSNGVIDYKDICRRMNIEEVPSVQQERGQLMGSIFSFPILCLINLCTYLQVLMVPENLTSVLGFSEQIPLKKLIEVAPVLINGDDILFKSPSHEFYQDWLWSAADAGFSPSIGKNYYSQKFLLVNSRYIHHRGGAIPYVNMGIISAKKKGEDSREGPRTLREKIGILPGYFKDLYKDFTDSDEDLRKSINDYLTISRTDLQWSRLHPLTCGITIKGYGGLKDTDCRHILNDQRRLRSRSSGWNFRTTIESSCYWLKRQEIDTSFINKRVRDFPLNQCVSKYVGTLMKDFFRKKEQSEIDERWAKFVTPELSHVTI